MSKRLAAFLLLVLLLVACSTTGSPRTTMPQTPPYPAPPAAPGGQNNDQEAARLFEKAEAYYRNNFMTKALESYLSLVERYPRCAQAPAALYNIGQIYLRTNAFENALYYFNLLVSEHPDSPYAGEAYFQMAVCHLHLQRYDSAIQTLNYYLQLPETKRADEAGILLGDCYVQLQRFADAVVAYASCRPDLDRDTQIEILKKVRRLADERLSGNELLSLIPRLRDGPIADLVRYRAAQALLADNRREAAAQLLREIDFSNRRYKFYETAQTLLETAENPGAGPVLVGPAAEETTAATAMETEAEYALGLLLPLSGPAASFGREVLNGIMLGFGLFDEPEAPRLQILVRDTHGNPQTAAEAVDELAQNPSVLAIIGPLLSQCAPAAAQAAERHKIPLITLTRRESIIEDGYWTFRNFLTASDQVRALIEYATQQQGAFRFAILYPDNAQGRLYRDLFQKYLDRSRYRIVAVVGYSPDETDFRKTIQQLKSAGSFDSLFIPDNHRRMALLAPQLVYYEIRDVMLLGTNLWNNDELSRQAGAYMTRSVFVDGFFLRSSQPAVGPFVFRFRRDYGHDPSFLAAVGFDTANMLKKILATGAGRSRDSLRRDLLALHDFPGVTGELAMDEGRQTRRRLRLLRVGETQIEELY